MFQPGGGSSVAEGSCSATSQSGELQQNQQPQQQSQQLKDSARQTAEHAVQKVSEKAGELKDRTRETVRTFADQARNQAGALFDRIRDQGGDALAQRKDAAADGINDLALALQGAADKLHDEGKHGIAAYAEDFSKSIERVSQYIRDRDLNAVLDDASSFIRRRPALFFGGMFVAGLAAARFLKASRRAREFEYPYDTARSSDDASAMAGISPTPASPGVSPAPGVSGGSPNQPESYYGNKPAGETGFQSSSMAGGDCGCGPEPTNF